MLCRKSAVGTLAKDREDGECQRILGALQEFWRRHEVTGANGPVFRPGFGPLFEDEEREDILAPTSSPARSMFPVALSLPVIKPWKPSMEIRKSDHAPKTLLGYHYIFNAQTSRGWSGENYLIRSDQAPYIDIAWGLAIDKSKSTATGSPHTHTLAWPGRVPLP